MASQLELQIQYADEMDKNKVDYTFAVGEAFVESMRSTRYDHTGTAIDELNDNAIEAGANTISIAFDSDKKPTGIAIIDNGHGMQPNMLRRAAAWGGTHRHNTSKREGMGRFGFGLPSASVNQARRFTVFSKLSDGDWHSVTVDLDDIRDHKYSPTPGKVEVPMTQAAELPLWIRENIKKNFAEKELKHGTIVLWEKLDRLTWVTAKGLEDNLLPHFGTIYRNYMSQTQIYLNNKKVKPVDPLFVTPGAQYFDENSKRAQARGSVEVSIKSKLTGEPCTLRVRYAAMPPGFYSTDDRKAQGFNNARARIKKNNTGIIICRMGRQIDTIERINVEDGHGHKGWGSVGRLNSNNDRYVGLELDFPADLDEDFTISNTKQGVIVSTRVWARLVEEGVVTALRSLRKEYDTADRETVAKDIEDDAKPRLSEIAAKEGTEQVRPGKVQPFSQEREEEAKRNFEEFFKADAKQRKIPEPQAKQEAEKEAEERPYKVEFETLPDAPFFRMQQRGSVKVLKINMAHRFYKDIYANNSSTAFMRYALEVVLFSIGEGELDGIGNVSKEAFYSTEKIEWSKKMNVMLGVLSEYIDPEDDQDAA